ncbi:type I polyketide synthase [[Clostridium] polysaccharolyticum]|uniref:Acyl transferase domain-containing protein n=1 Tax=[Clostridium] polysaccharolyticum TaxID=29364 RepID=A0A1H9YWH8_9FIRM|nr:type I polyketide synthase [[Clostridium] polysaccharolyticum]SES73464.1 Acyl transferase domain-containing protein [[Clostridium] polysaccharolyticum]
MEQRKNLVEVLKELSMTQKGITLVTADEQKKRITYHDLWNRSGCIKEELAKRGLKKGTEAIILCEDNECFLYSLWACILGGYIAVPLDISKEICNDNMLGYIKKSLKDPMILTDQELQTEPEKKKIDMSWYLKRIHECREYTEEIDYCEDDILYVQYSSGTTSKPRGAVITGTNVIVNTYDIIKHYQADGHDRFLSLSPLTHCFGLVAFHFAPIMARAEQCLISTRLYMNKPLVWADMITEFHATFVASLPFALKHFINIYRKGEKNCFWDFRSVKNLILGGEVLHYELCEEFCSFTRQYGFDIEKIIPMYGLSEGTVCVSTVEAGNIMKRFQLNKGTTAIGEKVYFQETIRNPQQETELVEGGTVLENVKVSIRDELFRELPEGAIGYVYVCGPSITKGYYKNTEETNRVFKEGTWLNTGDIGFVYQNHLILGGREKELVISNGKKIACVIIENLIQTVLRGTAYTQCVVCNGVQQRNESEKVIAFIKSDKVLDSEWEKRKLHALKKQIYTVVFEQIGITISEVIPVTQIPRTGSGKAFRRKLTELYNLGTFKESDIRLKKTVKRMYSRQAIEEKIVKYIESSFQVKVTDLNAPVFEYGVVSINIPSYIAALNECFQVNMSAGDIFTYFTIAKIANHINDLQREEYIPEHKKKKTDAIKGEKIAIVGMGCRFPGGANSIDQFWDLLVSGKDGISTVPKERWDVEKYFDKDRETPGKACNKKGGYLNQDIREFDARFFNISPKEANALDPQQRILLEVTWEAFENANMNIEEYNGSNTGVYVGICNNEYYMSQTQSGDLNTINPYSLTGCSWSTACGRISYTFGFEGPCASVDTACSSALTALHFACNALKTGEADMQVVAGVNLIESPTTGIGFSKLQATCPDGYCKSFDAAANGYARGEGCGVILLKRLSDAIRDKNEILAVVRATGINQDGKSNGLTAPNGEAQEKLIEKTMKSAGIRANQIDFVEMHGTGTKLGDPIEVNAVGATYGTGRTTENALKIGSVKSNIGHLESAAGTASIIKVLLAMKHHLIPGNLHFHEPNPFIKWESYNLEVVAENTQWEEKEEPRMAAINGFGFGGSNAHVILEEYKEKEETNSFKVRKGIDYILKITAQSVESLNALIRAYYKLLSEASEDQVADIIYTANCTRTDLAYRFLVCGSSRASLLERIKAYMEDGYANGVSCNVNNNLQKDRKVAFLYTGQGSQYVDMGKLLYETNAVFRTAMDECDRLFQLYLLKSILELVYGINSQEEQVGRTVYAQPLIFSIEYALSQMWDEIGVRPELVMGHSIGEYAAAVTAGIMSLEDAVKLVSARGRLMDMAPGYGKMAIIFASEETVIELLKGYENTVCIAAKNAQENHVISGVAQDVEEVMEKAVKRGCRTKELAVSHAFHSMLMEPVLKDFYNVAKAVRFHEAKVKFVSALYGKEIENGQILDADYWTDHIRAEVNFYGALTSVDTKKQYLFLEVGANRVLAALASLTFGSSQVIAATLSVKKEEKEFLPLQIAAVYSSGVNINWNNLLFAGKENWKKVTLPNYPYNKKKYWMELKYDRSTQYHAPSTGGEDYHPVLGQRIDVPMEKEAVLYQSRFSIKEPYFMSEHIIFDVSISPAAAHTSMLLSAVKDMTQSESCLLEHVEFRAPLAAKGEEERQVQIYLEKGQKEAPFKVSSRDYQNRNGKWLLHAQGKASVFETSKTSDSRIDPSKFDKLSFEENVEETIYDYMRSTGFWLGDGFRCIKKIHKEKNECICLLEPFTDVPKYKDYILYPGVIDSIFQSGLALILDELLETSKKESVNKTIIPYYIEKLTFYYKEANRLWCHTKSEIRNKVIYVDIEVYNEAGELVMQIDKMLIKLTSSKRLLREMETLDKQYYHMEWKNVNEYVEPRADMKDIKTLIFVRKEESLQRLSKKLEGYGADIVEVLEGEAYQQVTQKRFVIRSEEKADWSQLFKTISNKGENTGFQIIYFNEQVNDVEGAEVQVSYADVKSLFHVVSVVTKEGYLKNTKLRLVTKNVQSLKNAEEINLSGAMIWGLAKAISMECPEIYGGIVDIDDGALEYEDFLKTLLGTDEEEAVIREKQRYVARIVNHKEFNKLHSSKEKPVVIREDVSYLITGGVGALGMVYAERLVRKGAKHLILLARHQPDKKIEERIDNFRRQGVEVLIEQGDVCDSEYIQNVVASAKERGCKIGGVIHTAGVIKDKMLAEMDWNTFLEVLEPKVQGTICLYNALKSTQLDFFMMLSSLASVLGNMGQANYCSANYFLNTFASYLRKQGIPGYTFCWGPWKGAGLAAGNKSVSSNLERMGLLEMDIEHGEKMIDEFFEQPYENLVLSYIDWNKAVQYVRHSKGRGNLIADIDGVRKRESQPDEDKVNQRNIREELNKLSEPERKVYLSRQLQDVFGRIMGFDKGQLSIDEGMSEQGADSLMIFSMNAAVNQLLEMNLTVSVFFEYPTITKLVDYILMELNYNI